MGAMPPVTESAHVIRFCGGDAGMAGDDGAWGAVRVGGTSVGTTLGSGAGFNVGGIVQLYKVGARV
jgi:hypothetical protein